MTLHPSIVIIEDDEDDFLLVKEVLEENFDSPAVSWYSEAPDVDELLKTRRVDIVIVDYRLGKTSGDKYIREIRNRDSIVGIILLTGAPTRSLDFKASEIGASDFLSKSEILSGALERSIRFTLESVKQKRELNRQTVRLENILKPTKMVLWSMNLEGEKELFFSDSVLDLTGYSKSELQDGPTEWIDLVNPADAPGVAQMIQRTQEESRVTHKYRIRKKDGQEIWVEEELHFSGNENENFAPRIEGHIQDITASHDQEQQLRLLAKTLECAGDGILITDAQLEKPGPKIVYVNQSMLEMTGYSRDELIGRTPRIFQGPKTDRNTLKELKDCLTHNRPFCGETTNHNKEGNDYCVSWTIRPLINERGEVTHYVSVQRDVTNDHDQRQKLLHSEEFLSAMGRSGSIGGWRYHQEGDRLTWTDEIFAIHKLNSTKPPKMEEWLAFFPGESRTRLESALKRCLTEAEPFSLELSFDDRKGSHLWVRMKGEPQYNDGEISGAWGVFQDITKWYESDFRYRTFFNLSIDLSAVFSEEGKIVELNGPWEEVTGLANDKMTGMSFEDFVVEEDKERSIEAFKELLSDRGVFNFENTWKDQTGEIHHLLWNAKIDPVTRSIFCLCRDITEIKKKEILLQQALHRAEVANHAKNQFLMVASHELRTPLNGILGFTDILLEDIKDPEQVDMLKTVLSSAKRLTSIVSDILDISSIESQQTKIALEEFDLSSQIQSILDLLGGKAEDNEVTLELVRNDNLILLGQLPLCADLGKIRQILFNLIGNAIKFTHKGKVSLKVESLEREGKALHATISVTDTGIGIPEAELDRIFEPFHQVSMTATRRFGGQGLGLAICRAHANLIGGDILVESQVGKGSVFQFNFKAEISSNEIRDEDSTETPLNPQPESAKSNRPTVLLVEDDEINQRTMKAFLRRSGANCILASDGVEAVHEASQRRFSLILMDIQMPRMSGIEACREIRSSNGPNKDTEIVALTAHVLKSVEGECYEAGMNGFLEKPLSFKIFKNMIEEVTTDSIPSDACGDPPKTTPLPKASTEI